MHEDFSFNLFSGLVKGRFLRNRRYTTKSLGLRTCSKCPPSDWQHACSLSGMRSFRNARTAFRIDSWGRSSQTTSSTRLSSAKFGGFGTNCWYLCTIRPTRSSRASSGQWVGRPHVLVDEIRRLLLQPFLCVTWRVSRCGVLLERVAVRHQRLTIFHALREQTFDVVGAG